MATKKKLILHVGLPKTGTTALQCWCDMHREKFLSQNIDYPKTNLDPFVPKHQFLVDSFFANNFSELKKIIANNSANTLVLSTEGLTNHFYGFPEMAFATFRETIADYELIVFLVTREKKAWTKSLYKQAVINPPGHPWYATPLKYEDYCQLPRIGQLTNTSQLSADLMRLYGAERLVVAKYEENWLNAFSETIGLTGANELEIPPQTNNSVSDELIELIRQINGMKLHPIFRDKCLRHIQDCLNTTHSILRFAGREPPQSFLRKCKKLIKKMLALRFASTFDLKAVFANLVAENPAQQTLIDKLRAPL